MIPILQEDPHFLVVSKPAGLFSQAARGVASLQIELAQQLKVRDAHPGTPFIGLPHRLDRGTSGVMLIARNQRTLKRFGQQFQSRKIGKFYLAVVEGQLDAHASWQDYLRKVPDQPLAELVDEQTQEARLAQLDIQPVVSSQQASLVVVRLHTGRMHQIRVQAAARGHPVVGDRVYGAKLPFSSAQADSASHADDDPRSATWALHALRLEFRHPRSAMATSGTAPLPNTWSSLPVKLREAAQQLVQKSLQERNQAWSLERFSEGD